MQYVCVGYAYHFFVRGQRNDNRVCESGHCASTGWPRERNGCSLDSGRNMGQGGVLIRVTPSLPPTFPGEELSAGPLLFVALSHPPKQKLMLPAGSPTGLLPDLTDRNFV